MLADSSELEVTEGQPSLNKLVQESCLDSLTRLKETIILTDFTRCRDSLVKFYTLTSNIFIKIAIKLTQMLGLNESHRSKDRVDEVRLLLHPAY